MGAWVSRFGEFRRRLGRGPLVAALTALVVLAGSLAGTQLLPEGRGRAVGGPTWRVERTEEISFAALCDAPIGEPGPDASAAEVELIERFGDELADAATGCGVAPPQVFHEAIHQVTVEDVGVLVVFASSDGVVRLDTAQVRSYLTLLGEDSSPEAVAALAGYPVSVVEADDTSASSITLSNGGIVGRRRDTLAFWMDDLVYDLWGADEAEVAQRIGMPVTNPYVVDGGVRQEFEAGYLSLPISEVTRAAFDELDPDDIGVHVVELAEDPLEVFEGEAGIFRQPTGTMWWFDGDGRRRWIRDEETLECLGEDRMLIDDIDGRTLSVVPLGRPAVCGMAGDE